MTYVKLPAGYEDWVEVSLPEVRYTCLAPLGQKYLRVSHEVSELHMDGTYREVQAGARYFVPPKPKPVLPDVKPGAVIRFTSKTGKPERAVRNFESWSVYGAGTSGRMNSEGDTGWSLEWSDADLLERVNSDGFTVELEGL